jgi:copper chaperone NosL
MKTLLTCLLLVAAGCGNRLPQPVEIEASDICAQCKMAISEKRYAAELADRDGNVIKFDNLDCMIRYASGHGLKDEAAAWFVMDSEGKDWLDARQAFLVKSASIPGPMGSGVLAVKDRAAADGLAKRFSGQVLRFEDLWRQ